MKPLWTLSMLLVAATACKQAAPNVTGGAQAMSGSGAAAAPAAAGTRSVDITDPSLGIKAATLQLPADWKFAGTIARGTDCGASGAAMKYTAESADGATAAEVLPGMSWFWYGNQGMAAGMKQRGCIVTPVVTAAEFLKQIVLPKLRPDAQLVSIDGPRPEQAASLATQLQQMQQQTQAMAAQYHQPAPQLSLELATAHVTYTRAGHPVEENVTTVVSCTVASATQTNNCTARFIGLQRAPAGQLAGLRAQLDKIDGSVVFDTTWNQRVIAGIQQQGQAIIASGQAATAALLAKGAAEQHARDVEHAAFMQSQQDSVDHAMANDRATQAATDHAAQQTIQMVQGNGTYVDPNTGQATVTSSQSNHVWQGADGTVVHTNDPSYDPNGTGNQAWTELQPSN